MSELIFLFGKNDLKIDRLNEAKTNMFEVEHVLDEKIQKYKRICHIMHFYGIICAHPIEIHAAKGVPKGIRLHLLLGKNTTDYKNFMDSMLDPPDKHGERCGISNWIKWANIDKHLKKIDPNENKTYRMEADDLLLHLVRFFEKTFPEYMISSLLEEIKKHFYDGYSLRDMEGELLVLPPTRNKTKQLTKNDYEEYVKYHGVEPIDLAEYPYEYKPHIIQQIGEWGNGALREYSIKHFQKTKEEWEDIDDKVKKSNKKFPYSPSLEHFNPRSSLRMANISIPHNPHNLFIIEQKQNGKLSNLSPEKKLKALAGRNISLGVIKSRNELFRHAVVRNDGEEALSRLDDIYSENKIIGIKNEN